jgi:hypothetical protein
MGTALWLAGIFGPFLAIVGFWMLIYGANFTKVMNSMKNTPGAFYLSALLNLLLGIAIVVQYNVWVWDPAILVTLLGWSMIVRAFFALFLPQLIIKWLMSDEMILKIIGVIPFLWGLSLSWYAYLR